MALRFSFLVSSIFLGIISLLYTSSPVHAKEQKNLEKSSSTKSIYEWIDLLRTGSEEERRKAITALGAIKPLPKMALLALIEVVENCREPVSHPALQLIQNFGVEAKEYAPALLRLLKERENHPQNPYLHQEIALTLAKIDIQPHLEVTRILIFCGEGKRVDRSREFWTYVYRFPIPVTEQLLEIIRDDEIRRHQALIHFARYGQVTLEKQKPLLEIVEPKIHLLAQLEAMLGRGSRLDQEVFPTLIQLDPQMGVDHACLVAQCLDQGLITNNWVAHFLKPKAKEMMPTMLQGIRKTSSNMHIYQYILTQWPWEIVWPSLQQALYDRDPQLRHGAIVALGNMLSNTRSNPRSPGPQNIRKQIGKELLIALGDESDNVRLNASMQLAYNFPEHRNRLIRPLVGLIAHPAQGVQNVAIGTLGDLGSEAHAALPALFQSLTKLESDSRLLALDAIVSIDVTQSDRILEKVRAELKRDPSAYPQLLGTIQKMGPRAKDLVPEIVERIESQKSQIGLMAIDTLERIVPDQTEIRIKALGHILNRISDERNPKYQLRLVLQPLLRLGEKANSIVPLLEELRPRWDSDIQAVFYLVLFAIDPPNRGKYSKELRGALLNQNDELFGAFIDSPAIHPYLKDFIPIFMDTIKTNPSLSNWFANMFREIGKPMKSSLPELKTWENYLQTPQQKKYWAKYLQDLEAMKE